MSGISTRKTKIRANWDSFIKVRNNTTRKIRPAKQVGKDIINRVEVNPKVSGSLLKLTHPEIDRSNNNNRHGKSRNS